MSFWGATVITSLVTTIPIVGKQIVYWLWGGLKEAGFDSDIIILILLNAGKSQNGSIIQLQNYFLNKFKKIFFLIHLGRSLQGLSYNTAQLFQGYKKLWLLVPLSKNIGSFRSQCSDNQMVDSFQSQPLEMGDLKTARTQMFQQIVKMFCSQAQSAGLLSNSQRLNAKDLIWLVGFVEGDGSFSVSRNGKYVKYTFSIELSIEDIALLYKVKNLLGNVGGSITQRTRKGITTARFKIEAKEQLKSVILPIFETYPMLITKHYDFLFFKECLLKNITYSKDIPYYERPAVIRFDSVDSLLKTSYFDTWLVGFLEAEGSFYFFAATGETNMTAGFNVSQTAEKQIIEAIRQRLSISSNVFYKAEENSYSIATTSKHGVQNVINFLDKAPVQFKGLKKATYLAFLRHLRQNARYNHLKIPSTY